MNVRKAFIIIMFLAYGMLATGFFALIFHLSILAFVLSLIVSYLLLAGNWATTRNISEKLDKTTDKPLPRYWQC